MIEDLEIAPYDEELYPVFVQWREARGDFAPHPSWLPSGWVASARGEPMAMGFMDVSGQVGIGHLDWFTTRPGLAPGEAQAAIDAILAVMETFGKTLFPDSFAMLGCVTSQAMANRSRKSGFTPIGQVYQIAKGVFEEWEPQHSQSSASPPRQLGPE